MPGVGGTFTKKEFQQIVDWARQTIWDYSALCNVVNGKMTVNIVDGEIVHGITPKGEAEVEAMIADAKGE